MNGKEFTPHFKTNPSSDFPALLPVARWVGITQKGNIRSTWHKTRVVDASAVGLELCYPQ
jgi:hypothetical protein